MRMFRQDDDVGLLALEVVACEESGWIGGDEAVLGMERWGLRGVRVDREW